MDIHLVLYYIAVFIVFMTHIWMIYTSYNNKMLVYHSIINLIALSMIAYYFMNKEEFITF
jgi:hypothetical protein